MSLLESLQYSVPITATIVFLLHMWAKDIKDPAERQDD